MGTDEQPVKDIEVEKPVLKEGKIKFMGKAGFFNPAPAKLKMVIKALIFFCTGLNGMVASTTLFTGNQSKVIVFVISIFILMLGAIELSTGVQATKEEKP